jgi:ABC-type Zn2+ transport system substrate-binding protein/surface adhesin
VVWFFVDQCSVDMWIGGSWVRRSVFCCSWMGVMLIRTFSCVKVAIAVAEHASVLSRTHEQPTHEAVGVHTHTHTHTHTHMHARTHAHTQSGGTAVWVWWCTDMHTTFLVWLCSEA